MLDVIYEPKGRAAEYCPWAANLYWGCGHQCVYCYAPSILQTPKTEFDDAKPRPHILDRLTKDCVKLKAQEQHLKILLCFTCDPYQPINDQFQLTKQAIEMLHFYGQSVAILTKGGYRALADLSLLKSTDEFAVTLTCDSEHTAEWEPFAAPPAERIETLKEAKARGLYTWVSLEPVIYPEQSLAFIEQTHEFVDRFKLGTLNYHPLAKEIDWQAYGEKAIILLLKLKADYYIKNDLRQYIGTTHHN